MIKQGFIEKRSNMSNNTTLNSLWALLFIELWYSEYLKNEIELSFTLPFTYLGNGHIHTAAPTHILSLFIQFFKNSCNLIILNKTLKKAALHQRSSFF